MNLLLTTIAGWLAFSAIVNASAVNLDFNGGVRLENFRYKGCYKEPGAPSYNR
jgi:hypothetical protein